MQATQLLYLSDFNLIEFSAKVLDLIDENGKIIVILDQTSFYPQGGGQPFDKGLIQNHNSKFVVEEVRFVDGVVKHIGFFEYGKFDIHENVFGTVDVDRRLLHSRLHSAGHLIDMALKSLNLNWIPGKGYHFPDGPYVEYEASLNDLDKDKLMHDIETTANKFISENIKTSFLFVPKEKMHEFCHHVPNYLPEGKPSRVVMYGNFGVPCGGTHVNNLSEIKKIIVRKISSKGLNIRVGYDILK